MSEPPTSVVVLGDSWLHRRSVGKSGGPNFISESVGVTAGGAAHVALSLAALGRKTQIVTAAGGDADGGMLYDTCKERPDLWPRFVWTPEYTQLYETFVTDAGEILRHRRPPRELPTANMQVRGELSLAINSGPIAAYVIVDHDDGLLLDPLVRDVLRAGQTFVTAPADRLKRDIYGGATVVVISSKVALRWAQLRNMLHPALDPHSPVAIAEVVGPAIQRELHAQLVIITCGRFGSVTTIADQPDQLRFRHSLPEETLAVWDGNSTGESFLAGFVEGCLSGMFLEAALLFANRVALLAAKKDGPTIVTNNELDDLMLATRPTQNKLATVAKAAQMRHRLQARGRRVVVAAGTWDHLHGGHRYLLEQAGDSVLMVLVKELGETILQDRLRDLANLPNVAIVVTVSDVEAAVREIRPNVMLVGEEHRGQQVPGIDFVARHGGDIQFIPMHAFYATSNLHPTA